MLRPDGDIRCVLTALCLLALFATFALPVLAATVFYVYRRTRSWRPVAVAAVSVFMLNLVVLILKLGFGRSWPRTADPSFFTGGMAYPSGHSANIVLVYGLAAYLLSNYTAPSRSL